MVASKPYIKMLGLQRSGVTFLGNVLNSQFEIELILDDCGWRHGYYTDLWGEEVDTICVIKNPYFWFVSLYEYYNKDKHLVFKDFIRSIIAFNADGFPYSYWALNPIQHWNNLVYHYDSIQLVNKHSLLVPFEVYAAMKNDFLQMVKNKFALRDREICSEVLLNQRQIDFCTKCEYLNYYDNDDLKFVNCQLNHHLMNKIGYETINAIEKQDQGDCVSGRNW